MNDLEKDARIFCGLPPFHGWSNLSQGDGFFDASMRAKYGDAAWAAAVKSVVEREDEIRATAQNVAGKERDPNVELRGLLKEVLDVLHCHHRNTHKDLIGRVRAYRNQL